MSFVGGGHSLASPVGPPPSLGTGRPRALCRLGGGGGISAGRGAGSSRPQAASRPGGCHPTGDTQGPALCPPCRGEWGVGGEWGLGRLEGGSCACCPPPSRQPASLAWCPGAAGGDNGPGKVLPGCVGLSPHKGCGGPPVGCGLGDRLIPGGAGVPLSLPPVRPSRGDAACGARGRGCVAVAAAVSLPPIVSGPLDLSAGIERGARGLCLQLETVRGCRGGSRCFWGGAAFGAPERAGRRQGLAGAVCPSL